MGRVSIDRGAIERMAAEIQREFDKHPNSATDSGESRGGAWGDEYLQRTADPR